VLIFMLAIALSVFAECSDMRFVYIIPPLLCCAAIDVQGMIVTPSSSDGIYLQQYQMNRFVTNFYEGDFAVNDLGLVSFQRRPGTYVLDLLGLASVGVPQRPEDRTAAWLEEIVRRHNVDLVIVFAEDFNIPKTWDPIGRMCIQSSEYVHNSFKCVVFYSANPRSDQIIRSDLERFQATLPTKVAYTEF
jgi:hypothetical protein